MSQPTPYTPAATFNADELANAGGRATVRTALLDAEFDALAVTLAGILTNLALNQRDDGEIRDGRVKLHTLASEVKALMVASGATIRGAWLTATAYAVRDVVTQSGNTYICATAHTAGTFATDLAANRWVLISLGSATTAAGTPFTATATIAATNVQAAIDEADTENRALSASANAIATATNTDLATATLTKGAAIPAYDPTLAYTGQNAAAALRAVGMPLSLFPGADPTGSGDSTGAITAALTAQATNGRPIIVDGLFRYTSAITVSAQGARLFGLGGLTESAGSAQRAASCLLKDFNGQGITFAGDCQVTDGIQYDSTAARTGDIVQVVGSRWSAPTIAITNAGRDGVRISADSGSYNTNLWRIGQIITRSNGRHGLNINDPVGGTDAGGGVCLYADMIGNGGDGIKADNCTWNTFVSVVSQNNTGVGMRITANARSITVLGGDLEGNAGGAQGLLEAGTFSHTIIGAFYGSPACWTDSSGLPGRNTVAFYDPAIGAMVTGSAVAVTNYASGGVADVNLYADVGVDLVAVMRGQRDSGTGGKWALRTKANGGSQVDRMTCDMAGLVRTLYAFAVAQQLPTYGASVAIDASTGNRFQITANNNTAFTIASPTNPATGQAITICVRNVAGSALGTVTWGAAYKMAAWVSPATNFSRSITFRYDGSAWIEESRTPADVPN